VTRVVASAPGKLILFGEYAVLRGGPAIVLAIGRRARVQVTRGVADNLVTAPEICERNVPFEIDDAGKVRWLGADPAATGRLGLLGEIIGKFWPGVPVYIETDTSALHEDGIKMGFGSSAALTVAASAALSGEKPELGTLIEIHRAAQDGRGSGFDVAASLHGGVLMFRSEPLETTPLALPPGLHLRCVWTGHAASTSGFLRGLDALGPRQSALTALIDSAEKQVMSLGDTAASWVAAVQNFAIDLHNFACQTSLPVYAGGHAEVAEIAARHGVAYKPSGAGGGDLGVAVSADSAAMDQFTRDLRAVSLQVFEPGLDPRGLVLE